jgi:hypothetical protein
VSIHLNQIKVPGFHQKVSVSLSLAADDMSGNSSNTPDAETGDKAKEFTVKTDIRYEDETDLSALVDLAEARNDIDERVIYNILNNTARAMRVKQVRFSGDLTVREDDEVWLWHVTFKLVEYRSVPEKKEQRVEQKKITEQQAAGDEATGETTPPVQAEPEVELTTVEKMMQTFDELLAPDEADLS